MRRKIPARGGSLLIAVTALVFAASAGCSHDPTASAPPPPGSSAAATGVGSGTPSDTPSSTPTPSITQVDPRTLAAHAAITQVQIMYAEYNLMLTTGLADRFRSTYARACTVCTREAQRVLRIAARGQHIQGGICTVSHLQAIEIHSKTVIVRGRLAASSARVMAGSAVVNTQAKLPPTTVEWTLSYSSGRWLIYRAPEF